MPETLNNYAQKKVVYQGKKGAYSHLACQECYPQYEAKAAHFFEDCFNAVSNKEADIAMLPIENGLGGRVADVHHILPSTNLFIIGEHFQAVRHCLLAQSHVKLADVEYVYSHPQALMQSKDIILANKWQQHEFVDTAAAAEYIATLSPSEANNKAAIASIFAGDIYNLQTLKQDIQNVKENYTRFIILSRDENTDYQAGAPYITSMIFGLDSIPASLYKCIGGFATNSVNMIKLESYISTNNWKNAQFYLEVEGHKKQEHVARAIEELQYFASDNSVTIFGSFPANRHFS